MAIDPLGPLTRKDIPWTSSPDVSANRKEMPDGRCHRCNRVIRDVIGIIELTGVIVAIRVVDD